MLATELIKQVQKLIDQYGDSPVGGYWDESGNWTEATKVEHGSNPVAGPEQIEYTQHTFDIF